MLASIADADVFGPPFLLDAFICEAASFLASFGSSGGGGGGMRGGMRSARRRQVATQLRSAKMRVPSTPLSMQTITVGSKGQDCCLEMASSPFLPTPGFFFVDDIFF